MRIISVPPGYVRKKCKYCRKFHIVKIGECFTCPTSCESGFGGHYIAIDKNGNATQTASFENVKIFLNLKIKI